MTGSVVINIDINNFGLMVLICVTGNFLIKLY